MNKCKIKVREDDIPKCRLGYPKPTVHSKLFNLDEGMYHRMGNTADISAYCLELFEIIPSNHNIQLGNNMISPYYMVKYLTDPVDLQEVVQKVSAKDPLIELNEV